MRIGTFALPIAFVLLGQATAASAAATWIESCVELRRSTGERPSTLRRYCSCMREIVEDDRTFGVTELERSYPPAHLMCVRTSRQTPR